MTNGTFPAVSDASATFAAIQSELASAQAALSSAQGDLSDLEARVGDGDTTVAALDLVNARFAVDVATQRVNKHTPRAIEAQASLIQAKAHAVVDGWEAASPKLRAKIKETTIAFLVAREAVVEAVDTYNAEIGYVKGSLRGVTDPTGRFSVDPLGVVARAGNAPLKELDPRVVIAASLAPVGQPRAEARGLGIGDVLPY